MGLNGLVMARHALLVIAIIRQISQSITPAGKGRQTFVQENQRNTAAEKSAVKASSAEINHMRFIAASFHFAPQYR